MTAAEFDATRTLGILSEAAVMAVLTRDNMPDWFIRARHATSEEDTNEAFDVVIYTRDVGRILLQVKSSIAGKIGFEETTRRFGRLHRIHVVVARPALPPEVVLGRVLAVCVVAREEAQAARGVADDKRLYRLRMAA